MQLGELFSKTLRVDRPFGVFGLGVAPILAEGANGLPELDLLESAMAASTLRITEVSEGGSVPFLRAENVGRKPVLILDGEELVGGKQNRIVNASIIILQGEAIDIPVSCMEAGRWNFNRRDFQAGEAVFRARSRAVQKASVAASLDAEGSYRSDQGAVWREVSYSLRETQAPSPTSDYREGRAKVSHQIDSFVERVQPVDGQVGAIFLCARGILGLELLGEEDLFKGACPRSSGASPSRCSTTRISAACPKTWRPRGGRACRRPPVRGAPRPGRAMTSGSTRAR